MIELDGFIFHAVLLAREEADERSFCFLASTLPVLQRAYRRRRRRVVDVYSITLSFSILILGALNTHRFSTRLISRHESAFHEMPEDRP